MAKAKPKPFDDIDYEDGHLVRRVSPANGTGYTHRCDLESFEAAAHAVDTMDRRSSRGWTLDMLACEAKIPFTRAAVALSFMKERGVVVTRFRRNFAACSDTFIDAMVEYTALKHKSTSTD